ncbi:MAG TPA: GNAT family N-acetyltransferase [Polyangia bacterium]|jgi:predicted N-acetyltransferase YhbS
MIARMRFRALTSEDFPQANEVLRAAFHAPVEISFEPRLRRYLALQPDGWLVAEDEGQLVGMVGAIDYGAFAYVGLMAVRPDRQGRHLGRQLLEATLDQLTTRAEASGRPRAACAALDASAAGAPLYERMGFTDSGLSHEYWPGPVGAATADVAPAVTIAVATATAIDDLVQLDATFFGAPRQRLWHLLFGTLPGRVLLARDGDGAACGYVVAQDGLLGPFGARTPDVADALLQRAFAVLGHDRVRLQVPEENAEARALLAKRGFTLGRSLRHMRRGPVPELTGWRAIYGKGSYCLG